MKKNIKGFTLVELLVVIAIIGLISALAGVAYNTARQKSRDSKRLSDIKQIQTALELYYDSNSSYPATLTLDGTGSLASGNTTFMALVPSAPTPPAGNTYTYTMDNSGASYSLRYSIEGSSAGINVGGHTATPAGIANP